MWGIMASRVALGFFLLISGLFIPASAGPIEDYPDRIIKMVVPYPPGGTGDVVGRLIARELEKALQKPVIIDNRPGAGGNIGTDFVAKSQPDGYTILTATNGILAANPSLYRSIPFNPMSDFEFISQVADAAIVLVVHPSLPVQSVPELVALANKRAGEINFGSGGVGTTGHLAAELFIAETGAKLFHIAYKGTPPAHIDLLAGRVQVMFDQVATSLEDIRAGKLRPLAVTSAKRHPLLPNVPTVYEVGLKHSEATTWYGLVAPAGTPQPIIAKLNKAVMDAAQTPAVKDAFSKIGLDAVGSSPQDTRKFIEAEFAKWKTVIEKAGIRPN